MPTCYFICWRTSRQLSPDIGNCWRHAYSESSKFNAAREAAKPAPAF